MLNKHLVVASVLSISFALAFLIDLPTTGTAFSQGKKYQRESSSRDLSLYEQGKIYDFNWSKAETLRAERDEFRGFLWQQWSKQHRAKVTATFYSIEGDPTTSTYYIEPDESGRWYIAVNSESECCWFYAMQKPKKQRERQKYSATYSDLERVQEVRDKHGVFLRWEAVATGKQLPSSSYLLRFKHAGKESTDVF